MTDMLRIYIFPILFWYFITWERSLTVSSYVAGKPSPITSDVVKELDVHCVLSDIDGTLLSKNHEFSDETLSAIRNTINKGYLFFPCTGRSRSSMGKAVGEKFINLFGRLENIPGVYQQGLSVYGRDGKLIHQKTLNPSIIEKAVKFCDDNQIPVLAYSGEDVYCKSRCMQTDKIIEWSDPIPREVPEGLITLPSKGIHVQKMILVEDDVVLDRVRSKLEYELHGSVTVTKAVSGMLEVLPFGSSKGEGVQILLDHFQVSPDHVIAFGDGENDVEMLSLVKYGVAMENANPKLKERAKFLTSHVNDHGVANVLKYLKSRVSST